MTAVSLRPTRDNLARRSEAPSWRNRPRHTDVSRALALSLLVVICAAAATVRLIGVGDVGFNSDEAVYAGQGAALVGNSDLDGLFSVFRAHPLLLQLVVGGLFELTGVSDMAARVLVALLFGVGSVALTYAAGTELYDRRHGLIGASIVALLPYHVIISRQVLVDNAMAFFALLAFWLYLLGVRKRSPQVIALAAFAGALAFLAKEVAILAVLVFLTHAALTKVWQQVQLRVIALSGLVYLVVVAAFPLTRLLGNSANASAVFLWQLSRPPNHDADYFLRVILQFGGLAFVAIAAIGVFVLLIRRSRSDLLLLLWLAVFVGFFQFWPTKLFSYLQVVMPMLALVAAAAFVSLATFLVRGRTRPARNGGRHRDSDGAFTRRTAFMAAMTLTLVTAIGIQSWEVATAGANELPSFDDYDVEVQSFAGGREVGLWAQANVPPGSRLLTIGPSMGNILRFYGLRDSVALSVSPDPRKRNPAYVPVENPDLALRQMSVQYVVWDFYSADRSAFYNRQINRYIDRFGGIPVFSVALDSNGRLVQSESDAPAGSSARIIVYSIPGAATADNVGGP